MTDLKEATKYDQEKSRPELIDPVFLNGLGQVLAFGAKKYEDWNWAKGFKWLRICGSLLRHTYAFMAGEDKDAESGLPHVDHIACNAMFLSAHYHRQLGKDDRFKTDENITELRIDASKFTKEEREEIAVRLRGMPSLSIQQAWNEERDPRNPWPRDSEGGNI